MNRMSVLSVCTCLHVHVCVCVCVRVSPCSERRVVILSGVSVCNLPVRGNHEGCTQQKELQGKMVRIISV